MNYVICLKQVPDTTEVRIDPQTNTLIREGVPSIINPYDVHALEAALELRDRYGGKVILLSLGPPQAEASLRKGLGFGADEAFLLTDRAFAGSDTLATSYILACALRKIMEREPVDLILCGKQAIDGDTAQVGPGIARRLNIPQLTYVLKIEEIDPAVKEIIVQRKLEDGRETARTRLPALLTVVKDINEVRYAKLTDLIQAARSQITVWSAKDYNFDLEQIGLKGSPTTVSRIFAPPARPGGEIIPGGLENPSQAARVLADKLVTTKIIANM